MMEALGEFSFGQPWWLLLLLLLPIAAWMRGREGRMRGVRFSSAGILRSVSQTPRFSVGQIIRHFWLAVIFLCVLAMARPRLDLGVSPDQRDGVDIVFCVDVSGSMDQKSFVKAGIRITKRQALIEAIGEFVDNRPNDRFGMVGFAKDTYIMSPLTIDGNWIKDVLKEIRLLSWTAIGEGIVTSVELLEESDTPSKVIVVASDGGNNKGISPLEAAEMARSRGIRIHTVQFMSPDQVGASNVDGLMSKIATNTGGLYFQASGFDRIMSIYREIDRMETVKIEQKQFRLYEELFSWFVGAAGVVILVGWIGTNTLWLRIP